MVFGLEFRNNLNERCLNCYVIAVSLIKKEEKKKKTWKLQYER